MCLAVNVSFVLSLVTRLPRRPTVNDTDTSICDADQTIRAFLSPEDVKKNPPFDVSGTCANGTLVLQHGGRAATVAKM